MSEDVNINELFSPSVSGLSVRPEVRVPRTGRTPVYSFPHVIARYEAIPGYADQLCLSIRPVQLGIATLSLAMTLGEEYRKILVLMNFSH